MPGFSQPWQVAHLARRAGFGLTPADVNRLALLPFNVVISRFVDYPRSPIAPPGPVFGSDDDDGLMQAWWINRMLTSPRWLEEKMTLFWHGFFATSNDKVNNPPLMVRQNQLFRQNAVGDFEQLFAAVAIDAAMLIWLDGAGSTAGDPNENFARECMELFSIGVGNYTQNDVRAGARAFTGWDVTDGGQVVFNPDDHDSGPKTFLGQTGNFGYRDIAHILANHPACGPFLATKLWTFFAYDQPSPAIVSELAGVYRAKNRSIREVLRHMFTMPAFYSGRSVAGARVKGPVEYAVTAARELGAHVDPGDIRGYADGMDQALFHPPNVGGWPFGTRWITTTTTVGRFNFAEWLLQQSDDPTQVHVDLNKLFKTYGRKSWPSTLAQFALYSLDPTVTAQTYNSVAQYLNGVNIASADAYPAFEGALQLLLASPEYYCA